jgi:hypothetical protein
MIFKPKKVGEVIGYPVNFISSLAPTETILTAEVAAQVYSGTDPNPAAIILGIATFSGTTVNQGITGGLLGVVYKLVYAITTSLGQTIETAGTLAIVPDV